MKVILLEKIASVGALGDVVNVRPGYARNYLFPQRKAERANDEAIAKFESRRAELQKRQEELDAELDAAYKALDGYLLNITARASPDGNLYGSITPQMLAGALNAQQLAPGLNIKRGQISLPDGQIKSLGDFTAMVRLTESAVAKLSISILAETTAASSPDKDKPNDTPSKSKQKGAQ